MPKRDVNGGNHGQGSNWASKEKRRRIHDRDGWKCVWCASPVAAQGMGSDLDPALLATLDHVIPREQGGTNAPTNLITSCMSCNRKRGSQSALLFAWQLGAPAAALNAVIEAIERPLPP